VRAELERYIRDDLAAQPVDARTFEKDEKTVRNLWRLEKYNAWFRELGEREDIKALIAPLVHGEPVLCAVETFNKPARIGSGVPYHQDNAYFCQTPPDMLTVWIAIDAVTEANGPVYFVKGSHRDGMQPTKPSGVRGNSIGMAEPSPVPLSEQFCGLLSLAMPPFINAKRFIIRHRTRRTSPASACCLFIAVRTHRPIRRSKPPTRPPPPPPHLHEDARFHPDSCDVRWQSGCRTHDPHGR
jgi:hypothetical protein